MDRCPSASTSRRASNAKISTATRFPATSESVSNRRPLALRSCRATGIALVALFAFGCFGCTRGSPRAYADAIADQTGFRKVYRPTGRFTLTSYVRAGNAASLTIYFEGDGHAFRTRTQPSRDPSPRHPLALELATRDPAPSVVYLARPCQFTTPQTQGGCETTYWTERRFSPEVVDASNRAIDLTLEDVSADALHLVGFSGGGVLATLVAARRDDVRSLTTIGAPLDLAAWIAHHDLTPLFGSLDPASDRASHRPPITPQVHLIGSKDTVVPRSILDRYLASLPQGAPAEVLRIEGLGHREGWEKSWSERIDSLRNRADSP